MSLQNKLTTDYQLFKKLSLILFWISALFISISCQAQDCHQLPTSFTSYQQAEKMVKAADFKIYDSVNTSKSSWIRGAEFYSCDGRTGFFIFKTDSKAYIYKDLPIEVWQGFKNAASFGSYYNSFIKGKWRMVI